MKKMKNLKTEKVWCSLAINVERLIGSFSMQLLLNWRILKDICEWVEYLKFIKYKKAKESIALDNNILFKFYRQFSFFHFFNLVALNFQFISNKPLFLPRIRRDQDLKVWFLQSIPFKRLSSDRNNSFFGNQNNIASSCIAAILPT